MKEAGILNTGSVQVSMQFIDRILREEIIGVAIANVGVGKTIGTQAWRLKKGDKHRYIYIEVRVLTRPRPLLNALVAALGIAARSQSSMYDTQQRISARLAEDPVLLLIDQADMLTWPAFEMLREMWDAVSEMRGLDGERGFPLAFFGAPKLRTMLNRDDLERLRRRIFHWTELPALTVEELKGVLAKKWPGAKVQEEALEDLHRMSRGSFGWVNNFMRTALELSSKNGGLITAKVMQASAKYSTIGLPEEE